MPPRRVTLSTVGLLPALERLAHEADHAEPRDLAARADRRCSAASWCRINKKYGVADIIAACKRFPLRSASRITFEYVLLAGVNDSPRGRAEAGASCWPA